MVSFLPKQATVAIVVLLTWLHPKERDAAMVLMFCVSQYQTAVSELCWAVPTVDR